MWKAAPRMLLRLSKMRKPKPANSFQAPRRSMRRLALGFLAAFAFMLFVCLLPAAAPVVPLAHAASRVWPTGYWGPLLSCTGNYNNVVPTTAITNTCNNLCDLLATAQNVVDFGITIVIFVGAPAMITFGGIMLLIAGSAGGDENRKLAKDIIVSAVIGVAIVLAAYVILSTFLWLTGNANSSIKVSWPNISCSVPASQS